jgi:hypothetical protein
MSNLLSMVDARKRVQLDRAIAAMEIRIAEVRHHIGQLKAMGIDTVSAEQTLQGLVVIQTRRRGWQAEIQSSTLGMPRGGA